MADIDKALPNERPEDEVLKEQMEEVDIACLLYTSDAADE